MVQCSSSNEHFFAMSQPRLSNQNHSLSKKNNENKKIILNIFIMKFIFICTLYFILG